MMKICKKFFVTGTDTGVGKTIVSSCLVYLLGAAYWKPVQSGSTMADDSEMVHHLTGISFSRIYPCLYKFPAPLSPHMAADISGAEISLDNFYLPTSNRPLVIEGAGGILAPLNNHYFMLDLIARLNLPVILVARSSLGTINHTLLSLAILRDRGLTVQKVVMNGPRNQGNYTALKSYGNVPVRALPYIDQIDITTIVMLARLL